MLRAAAVLLMIAAVAVVVPMVQAQTPISGCTVQINSTAYLDLTAASATFVLCSVVMSFSQTRQLTHASSHRPPSNSDFTVSGAVSYTYILNVCKAIAYSGSPDKCPVGSIYNCQLYNSAANFKVRFLTVVLWRSTFKHIIVFKHRTI